MARSPTQGLEAECPLQVGQPPAWVQSLAECPWPRQVPEPVPAPSRGSHNAFLSWAERVRRVMTYGMRRAQLVGPTDHRRSLGFSSKCNAKALKGSDITQFKF